MKSRVLLTLVITMFALSGCVANQTKPDVSDGVEISDVVEQVQQALADVQTELANSKLPPLKQVKLSLATSVKKTDNVSFTVLVITIGGTSGNEKTQKIELTLIPPKPGNPKLISSESITQALESAILSAAKGISKVETPEAGSGLVALTPSAVDVTIGFTVTSGGKGGAKPVLLPLSFDLSGDVSTSAVHTIVVSFAPPERK